MGLGEALKEKVTLKTKGDSTDWSRYKILTSKEPESKWFRYRATIKDWRGEKLRMALPRPQCGRFFDPRVSTSQDPANAAYGNALLGLAERQSAFGEVEQPVTIWRHSSSLIRRAGAGIGPLLTSTRHSHDLASLRWSRHGPKPIPALPSSCAIVCRDRNSLGVHQRPSVEAAAWRSTLLVQRTRNSSMVMTHSTAGSNSR